MTTFRLPLLAALLCAALPASAQDWFSVEAGGVRTAWTESETLIFNVNCVDEGAEGFNSVEFLFDGEPAESPAVLAVGKRTYVIPLDAGMLTADTAESAGLFFEIAAALRGGVTGTVTSVNGTGGFGLKGSAKAIGPCPPRNVPGELILFPEGARPDAPIIHIEAYLARLGYDTGPVDGTVDDTLRDAIRAWERDTGRRVRGDIQWDEFDALGKAVAALPPEPPEIPETALEAAPSDTTPAASGGTATSDGIIRAPAGQNPQ